MLYADSGDLDRRHADMHEICILDEVDHEVPVLRRMYAEHQRTYTKLGYRAPDTPASGLGIALGEPFPGPAAALVLPHHSRPCQAV